MGQGESRESSLSLAGAGGAALTHEYSIIISPQPASLPPLSADHPARGEYPPPSPQFPSAVKQTWSWPLLFGSDFPCSLGWIFTPVLLLHLILTTLKSTKSSTRISDRHARYRLHQSQQPQASHWAAGEGQTPEPGALTKPQLQLHDVSESPELCGWVNHFTRITLTLALYLVST